MAMVERPTFYTRLSICKQCEFWQGACLKGHDLNGLLGCPLKKFAGSGNAGYLPDLPTPVPELPAVSANGCCGADQSVLKPMSWGDVWWHLTSSMLEWAKAGLPLAPVDVYVERINACRNCPKKQYQWYQCKHCRCNIYTKGRLATESCPFGVWQKVA